MQPVWENGGKREALGGKVKFLPATGAGSGSVVSHDGQHDHLGQAHGLLTAKHFLVWGKIVSLSRVNLRDTWRGLILD